MRPNPHIHPSKTKAARFAALLFVLLFAPAAARAVEHCLENAPCRELIDHGRTQSKAEKFESALGAYQRAYEKWPDPWILVNIGRMQQKLGQLDAAAASFRQYLVDPTADRDEKARVRASEYLAQIEEEQSKQKIQPAPEQPPASPAAPEPPILVADTKPPLYKRWWLWTSVGIVVLGGTLAAVLGTQIDPRPVPSEVIDLRGHL